MTPRNSPRRNASRRGPDQSQRGLLSVRTAVVLTPSLIATGVGAVLLYAAHRPAALIVLGAFGAFVAAVKFINWMIE